MYYCYYPSQFIVTVCHFVPLASIFIIIWKTVVKFLTCNSQTLNSHIYYAIPRDYHDERVNLTYRPSTQGSRSKVIFRNGSQFFRRCYSRVAWMFSWRICLCFASFRLKAKQNLPRSGDVFFEILTTSKGLQPSLCFNTFQHFYRSFNKRQMSPLHKQLKHEWTAEKWLDSETSANQTNAQTQSRQPTNRWSKNTERRSPPEKQKAV